MKKLVPRGHDVHHEESTLHVQAASQQPFGGAVWGCATRPPAQGVFRVSLHARATCEILPLLPA